MAEQGTIHWGVDVNLYGVSVTADGSSEDDFILFLASVATDVTVKIVGGSGNDEMQTGVSSLALQDNAFTFENGGSTIGSLEIDAGAGNDRANVAANAIENLYGHFGDGDDSLTLDSQSSCKICCRSSWWQRKQ